MCSWVSARRSATPVATPPFLIPLCPLFQDALSRVFLLWMPLALKSPHGSDRNQEAKFSLITLCNFLKLNFYFLLPLPPFPARYPNPWQYRGGTHMSYTTSHQSPFMPQLCPSKNTCLSLLLSYDLPKAFPFLNFGFGCSFPCNLHG